MKNTGANVLKSKYRLSYILKMIALADKEGDQCLTIYAPYDSAGFIEAIRANRIECELRDRGYIANLITDKEDKAYLYISW